MEDKWLAVNEICKYLSLRDTVYKWIEHKQMPANKVGRKWLFRKDEVDAWVKSSKAADEK
ncbi:MAG: helix-turn-helix domain-containing protein [Campylobacterales bacterium]|nr:helix-turn-helix domain-containing protein [Campylobacterales bacterium]